MEVEGRSQGSQGSNDDEIFFTANNGVLSRRSGSGLPNQKNGTWKLLLLPAGLKFRKTRGVVDSLHLFRHFWTISSTLVRWPFYLYARMQDVDHEVEILKGGVVHLEKMFCGSWDYPLAQSPQSSLGEYQFIIFMLVLLVPIFKIHGSVLFTVNKNLTQKKSP